MFATETFRLHVVERPDPSEVLGWIGEGLVRLRVPIRGQKLQVGPIAWTVDSCAVLEVPVRSGEIDRPRVRGHLDPPVRLPLGFDIHRIRLSPEGDVLLGLRGLPDLNLSAILPWLPRIPPSLRTLGERLAERASGGDGSGPTAAAEDAAGSGPAPRPEGPAAAARSAGIVVEASHVRPLPGVVVDLGPAGRLQLGEDSELDVHYAAGRLHCSGRLVLDDGDLRGPAFEVRGLRSTGEIRWERRVRLELTEVTARADRLEWSHEHDWHLVDVRLASRSLRHEQVTRDVSVKGEIELEGRRDPESSEAAGGVVRIRVRLTDQDIETVDLGS